MPPPVQPNRRPRLLVPLVTGLFLAMAGAAAGAQTDAGARDRGRRADRSPLLGYLEDWLAEAERAGAVVVLQLDTPGALGQDGIGLAERVARAEVPVLAWVGPVPAKASGAGLLVMLSSSLAAVAPGSQTGPSSRSTSCVPPPRTSTWTVGSKGGSRTEDARSTSVLGRPLTAQQAIDAGIAEVAAYTVRCSARSTG